MTLAEKIYREALNLPAQKAQEVLDFVEALKSRSATGEENHSEAVVLERKRQKARELLARTRIDFGGKPMTDREEANARR